MLSVTLCWSFSVTSNRLLIMNSFISLLRGINVTGYNMIRMPELKALYESLGFGGVTTYIQSGNVIFQAAQKDPDAVSTLIEQSIEKKFGFLVRIILRRPAQLARVIKSSPLAGSDNIDESRLYVTFLKTKPTAALLKALKLAAAKSSDQYIIKGNEVYLHCPNGYGKTLLSNTFFEKHLKVVATTRNWKTVNTLYAMAAQVNA